MSATVMSLVLAEKAWSAKAWSFLLALLSSIGLLASTALRRSIPMVLRALLRFMVMRVRRGLSGTRRTGSKSPTPTFRCLITGEVMSEVQKNEVATFALEVAGHRYDFSPVFKALGFSHDYVAAEDLRNAAKNTADPKLSPLCLVIEEAIELLLEIRDKHCKPDEGSGNGDDPANADA